MKKLTYTNDQQLINDAAQMLIENHLRWSNSNDGLPSGSHGNVDSLMLRAWVSDLNDWHNLSDDDQRFIIESEIVPLYKRAQRLADRKWEAAMLLLGIEQ